MDSTKKRGIRSLFGDRAFYKTVIAVMLPIVIQNGVTNLVNLLDNVMVGQLSTESMSGVSIVNQFVLIFYLAIFGGMSGPGIYTAQFHGKGDEEGERKSFLFKIYIALAAAVSGIVIFSIFGENFISLFLHDGSQTGDLELTMQEGLKYLKISMIGFIPYALSNAFAATLRETGKTVLPMISGIAAVGTNFALNIVLIFGYLGFPAMGVEGAAIATVISRFVELIILVIGTIKHKADNAFIRNLRGSFRIGKKLASQMLIKSIPLLTNEILWSLAIVMRNQTYSTRGLDVVGAQNIASTLGNLFNVVYLSVGTAVAILIGNLLGASEIEKAKDHSKKLIAFSVICAAVTGVFMAISAPFFPKLYQTSDEIRELATYMLFVQACFIPIDAICNSAYFTLRSGGRIFWTIVADSGFMWTVATPLAMILAYGTNISIWILFPICYGTAVLKATLSLTLLKVVPWARSIVGKKEQTPDQVSEDTDAAHPDEQTQ
ncbi:MAG: MATE family efflux transporter [Clostridia bacterium]|nr:MATE family efflux transporter [Clostridia bacterium]